MLLVQGDTTSAVAAALAAFHARIPVGHVEAGLRSFDLTAPFPEEANRRLLSVLASQHFCPTMDAAKHLERESITGPAVHVTGNTIVDALEWIRLRHPLDLTKTIPGSVERPFVLVTAHRRESFGEGFRNICAALRQCAEEHTDLHFVYPVHLNPRVRGPVEELLSGIANIMLLPPVSYLSLLTLLQHSAFVLTDSGGIQEEAPSFGKHCIVMRDRTERMESVNNGLSELVGAHREAIVAAVRRAWLNKISHHGATNPYGDGKAAIRILDILRDLTGGAP
jgi:UDP-N-acetylglucosamine 2-epimerase (non-hydrolysing)